MDEIDLVLLGNMEFFERGTHDRLLAGSWDRRLWSAGLKITTGGTVGATTVCAGVHHVASGLFDKVLCIGFEKQEEGIRSILSGVAHPLWGRPWPARR